MASAMLFETYSKAQAYRDRLSPANQAYILILRPAKLTWVEVDEHRYDEMLNILPPVFWEINRGFLVGEAWDHDAEDRPRYAAFARVRGRCYEATLPMTLQEFTAIDMNTFGS